MPLLGCEKNIVKQNPIKNKPCRIEIILGLISKLGGIVSKLDDMIPLGVKISTFGENLDFRRKSRLLVKISTFGENLDFMRHNPQ